MNSVYAGRRCLVTGAASGIGRALAEALAAQGAVLFLTDVQDDALQQLAGRLRDVGAEVAAAEAMDIADAEAVLGFAQRIGSEHGAMDMLFNVAGISIWGSIDRLGLDHWRRLVDVNLMGPVHVMHAFLPAMIAAGRGGHLINVSSAAGLFGLPWHAAYSATKFGLRGISEVLRFDLRPHGIAVSLVCPGAVDTGLVRTLQVVGVDRDNPELQAVAERFQRHAASPERAAATILRGVRRRRPLIFTSWDIRFGYWMQRKWAWPYEVAMRLLNRYLLRRAEGHLAPPRR